MLDADRRGGQADGSSRTAVVFKRPLPYVYLASEVFGSAGIPFQTFDAIPLAAEPTAAALDLESAGVPVIATLAEPACAEAGDLVWLDERTLLAGRTYRTNGIGIAALAEAMPGVDVVALDLPHFRGRRAVLHLMSVISMLDADLAVVYPPLAPVRLLELLAERGVGTVEVPDDEFETMGPNVLALAPRVALAAAGNPETRRRLEAVGVDLEVYASAELGKGDGGPTCLTRPLLRDPLG